MPSHAQLPEPLVLTDLVKVNRTEAEVYRGNERRPMLALESPAFGTFNARGTRRLTQVCDSRGLGSNRPNRLATHFSHSTRMLVCIPSVFPEDETDDDDEDLFEVKWMSTHGLATVNLIELLQPLNMTVPRDQVMEVPVSVRMVEGHGVCLVIDFSDSRLRDISHGEAAGPAAAGRQPG